VLRIPLVMRQARRQCAGRVSVTPRWRMLAWLGVRHALSTPPDGAGTALSARRTAQVEQWFTRYQPTLLNYLYGMTRDREWAADLVQETFLRVYSARDLSAIQKPQAWLYRVATNLAITALRRRHRFGWLSLSHFEARPEDEDKGWARPEVELIAADDLAATVAEREAIWSVLAELPPRWRAVLLLQTTAGFEVSEIAAQLQLSEANVRKILFRAKERFRTLHARLDATDVAGDRR
jgi:RNA polymerase sigma-70 factor (ECF subfamily)